VRLDPCTFDGHGPVLAEPVRQIRNNVSIVWLSPPLCKFKQNSNSIECTLTVAFPLELAFESHRVVSCELVDIFQWRGKAMKLTVSGARLVIRAVDRA
jgi:hypothetical protein